MRTIKDKILERIQDAENYVFMRQDFSDISNYDQVGRALRAKSATTWTPNLVLVAHSNKLLGKLEYRLTWTVGS